MKKFLLTAALVLALVTSLTAGTMAFYSTDVTEMTRGLMTKTFDFTADEKSSSFTDGIKIAPGDDVKYYITVRNTSEVKTDATVTATLSNHAQITGLSVKVDHEEDGSDSNGMIVNGTAGNTSTATTLMGTDSYQKYLVTVSWDYESGNTLDNGLTARNPTLTVNINGKQHNEDIATTANIPAATGEEN